MKNPLKLDNNLMLNGYEYWQPSNYEIFLSEKNRLIFQFCSDNSNSFNSFFKQINEQAPLDIYFSNKHHNSIYLVTKTNFILLSEVPENATTFVESGQIIFVAKDKHEEILFILD